jgi:hypothetical protein
LNNELKNGHATLLDQTKKAFKLLENFPDISRKIKDINKLRIKLNPTLVQGDEEKFPRGRVNVWMTNKQESWAVSDDLFFVDLFDKKVKEINQEKEQLFQELEKRKQELIATGLQQNGDIFSFIEKEMAQPSKTHRSWKEELETIIAVRMDGWDNADELPPSQSSPLQLLQQRQTTLIKSLRDKQRQYEMKCQIHAELMGMMAFFKQATTESYEQELKKHFKAFCYGDISESFSLQTQRMTSRVLSFKSREMRIADFNTRLEQLKNLQEYETDGDIADELVKIFSFLDVKEGKGSANSLLPNQKRKSDSEDDMQELAVFSSAYNSFS